MLSRLLRRDPAAGFDTHRLQTKQFHSTTRRQSTSRLPNSAVRPHARCFTHLAQHHPTLRANPYPEVTDLFCRLPLPTLFYQLEAFHLGDLLRLSVRPDARIKRWKLNQLISLGFSRTVRGAPDTLEMVECFTAPKTLAPGNLISGSLWDGCGVRVKKKRKLFPRASASVSEFSCVAAD